MMKLKVWLILSLLLILQQKISAQETTIRGFVDASLTATGSAEHFSFALGQYDMYITSELSDRIMFLGETVFEFDEGWIVDVERVLLKYVVSDYLNVIIGKHHTPIGYWNTAYNHGSLLQPTARRPLLFRFEDEGGLLPIHTTGILFHGDYITRFKLGYDLMIGNGIGSTPVGDDNHANSVTLALRARLTEGLLIGVSAYRDKISAGTQSLQDVPLAGEMTQEIRTATLVYSKRPFELMVEVSRITNSPALSGAATTTTGLYVYGGYRIGNLVPYFRFDKFKFDDNEQYYLPDDTRHVMGGLRYELNFLAALKLEFHHSNTEIEGTHNSFDLHFEIGF